MNTPKTTTVFEILAILMLMLALTTASARDYIPFPEEGAKWNVEEESCGDGCNLFQYDLEYMRDTVINGRKYNEISSGDYSHWYVFDSNKIVSLYDLEIDEVFPLYDFNLHIGDTFQTKTFYVGWIDLVVEERDSIIINNQYRTRISLRFIRAHDQYPTRISRTVSGDWFSVEWIEGIGSTLGPLYYQEFLSFSNYTQLNCYHNSSGEVYGPCYDLKRYIPFIGFNLYWDLFHYDPMGSCGFSNKTGRYFFQGDTIIEGFTYTKMFSYNTIDSCEPRTVDSNATTNSIFVREDIKLKQVYRYYEDKNSEVLLFDFSLEKGDTLKSDFFEDQIVDNTYLIFTYDGRYRKFIQFKDSANFMIEGVGGSEGPFNPPLDETDRGYELSCMKAKNGPEFIRGECFSFVTSVNNLDYSNAISVYPNPAKNIITLDFGSEIYDELNYEIYNLNLQKIKRGAIQNQQAQIDVSEFKSGLYMVRVNTYDKLFSKIFIVE